MTQRHPTAWFAQRAALAIALMVGFYVLALSVAGLLVWIPYAEWRFLNRVDPRTAFFCLAGAVAILSSIVPRKDHFTPPGPRLDEDDHPRLFHVLREVASATGQRMPSDVYLLHDVNAFVAERGGRMGVGGVRVMGVGLPLIQALTVNELRAVIAHEFGHYWSGDLTLGPWIYKTHGAIARAVDNLGEGMLSAPFVAYNRVFLRLTMAVSRRQEFVADEVAARVTSPRAAAAALERVALAGPALSMYVRSEVLPTLSSGFLPPIASGFDSFLQSQQVNEMKSRVMAPPEESGQGHDFDTHPPLHERLAALAALSEPRRAEGLVERATTLLTAPETLAESLLRFANGDEAIGRLTSINWSEVGEKVFAARWRVMTTHFAASLATFTVDSLPSGEADTVEAGRRLVNPGEPRLVDRDAARARAIGVLTAALGVCLLSRGWSLKTAVGEPLALIRGTDVIDPGRIVVGLATGTLDTKEWTRRSAAIGLAGCVLSPPDAQASLG